MADRCCHPTNLAIFSLDKPKFEPGIGNIFAITDRRIAGRNFGCGVEKPRVARERSEIAQIEAAFELSDRGGGRHAFYLGPILTRVLTSWIEKTRVEFGFVRQQEQTLGIRVEPTERIDVTGKPEISERAPARTGFGGELRENAVGLVECEQHAKTTMQQSRKRGRTETRREGRWN